MSRTKKINHKNKEVVKIKGLLCPCCCSVTVFNKEKSIWECKKCRNSFSNKLKL